MIVHAQDYAVIFKTEEVPANWILHIVEGPDLNDVVWRMIRVLAFLPRVFGPVDLSLVQICSLV